MSPALDTIERIRRTEQVIAYLRFAVVTFNIILYFGAAPESGRRTLATFVAIGAFAYALITLWWRPQNDRASIASAYASMVIDNLLIGVWLFATDGFASPFYPLFYAASAASVGRFGARRGFASAFSAAVIYLAVVYIDGTGPFYEVAARIGYIFLITAFVAYVAEIARSSEMESALAEREAAAYRELDQLRSTFVRNISHELRTPLTVIRGAASTLGRAGESLEEADTRSLVTMIERHAGELGELVEDIIDTGLAEHGRISPVMSPTDLKEVVLREVGIAKGRITREIECVLPEGPVTIECDARKIGNALRKVIDNAIKFSPDDSVVTVTLDPGSDPLVLTVADKGVGIAPEHQAKIFERFWQVDGTHTRTAEGAGIGLSIARSIMQLQGGDIRVASVPGHGTTFSISIPRRLPRR
jgi:signal transduction histidine kinase